MTEDPFQRAVLRDERERRAAARAHSRGALLIHAAVYVAVNVMLIVIWALTSRGHAWFLYPLLGWGIGLAAHAAAYRAQLERHRGVEQRLGLYT